MARLKPCPDTCLAFGHALAPEKYSLKKRVQETERNHAYKWRLLSGKQAARALGERLAAAFHMAISPGSFDYAPVSDIVSAILRRSAQDDNLGWIFLASPFFAKLHSGR